MKYYRQLWIRVIAFFWKKFIDTCASIICIALIWFAYKWYLGMKSWDFSLDQITNEIKENVWHKWSQIKVIKADLRGYGEDTIIVFTGLPQWRENWSPDWIGSKYYPRIAVFEKRNKNPIEDFVFPNPLYSKKFFIQPKTQAAEKNIDTMELTWVKLINNGTPHIIFQWDVYWDFPWRRTYLWMLKFNQFSWNYEITWISCNARTCHDAWIMSDMSNESITSTWSMNDIPLNILSDSTIWICNKNSWSSLLIVKNEWVKQLGNWSDHNSNSKISIEELNYNDSAKMYTTIWWKRIENIDTSKTSIKTLKNDFDCKDDILLLDWYYLWDWYAEILTR